MKALFPFHSRGTPGCRCTPHGPVCLRFVIAPLRTAALLAALQLLWPPCCPQMHQACAPAGHLLPSPPGILFPRPVCPLPFLQDLFTRPLPNGAFANHVDKVTQISRTLCLPKPTFVFSTALITYPMLLWGGPEGKDLIVCPASPSCLEQCLSHSRGSVNIC